MKGQRKALKLLESEHASRTTRTLGSRALLLVAAVVTSLAGGHACAQRATENAVKAAEDAFGVNVGRETIGLYDPDNVRGFSAIDAGNARIDGIYFDPVWRPPSILQKAETIRVGIAAQGFSFPAPTGVVDYGLRRPGEQVAVSGFLSADTFGYLTAEVNAEMPIAGSQLTLGAGLSAYNGSYYNGTTEINRTESLILRWRPTPSIEVLPFFSHANVDKSQASPLYLTLGGDLPPFIARRQFNGPSWAKSRSELYNLGILVNWQPIPGWGLQGGLIRSGRKDPINFTNLYVDLTSQGNAYHEIIVDPAAQNQSTSGELRLSHAFDEKSRRHTLSLLIRARDRGRRYDGSDLINLGPIVLGEQQNAYRPTFVFGTQDRDRIRQGTIGVSYEGHWDNVGDLSVSVQKTSYSKRVTIAGQPTASTHTTPVLFSVATAANITGNLTAYASYTRGLEDSGSAPSSAENRNEPLPAIETSQADAGIRLALTKSLRFVAGVFSVRKPYFELDISNRFIQLGTIENTGIEVSFSGAATPRLDIVAGAVLSSPRVAGEGVGLGLVGADPVDKPHSRISLDANWQPPILEGVTLEAGLTYIGRRAATTDDRIYVPSRALVDLGARYSFSLNRHAAQLRLSVTNVGNIYGFDLFGAGVYDTIAGRIAQLSLGIDW